MLPAAGDPGLSLFGTLKPVATWLHQRKAGAMRSG